MNLLMDLDTHARIFEIFYYIFENCNIFLIPNDYIFRFLFGFIGYFLYHIKIQFENWTV